jgi:hypothetical protein
MACSSLVATISPVGSHRQTATARQTHAVGTLLNGSSRKLVRSYVRQAPQTLGRRQVVIHASNANVASGEPISFVSKLILSSFLDGLLLLRLRCLFAFNKVFLVQTILLLRLLAYYRVSDVSFVLQLRKLQIRNGRSKS